jgi:Tfp pilus assembly protein PilO
LLFLEKLKTRERVILYLACLLIALSLIYNFIFEPIINKYKLINQEILKNQVKLQKYLTLLSQKEKIKQEFGQFSKSLKVKASEEQEMAEVLSQIEDLSRRAAVHISQIKPQGAKDYKTYKEFLVEIRAEAKIENLSQFIYELQSPPQLLRTKKLLLNTKTASTDILEATILIAKISLP